MSEEELTANSLEQKIKNATNSACRMLAIREHSHQQIKVKLAKKGYCDVSIEKTIKYLIQENWISEARFCESFIRSKSAKGQGLKRILHELRKENIHGSLIEQAMKEEPVDWSLLCKNVLSKKIKSLNIESQVNVRSDVTDDLIENNKETSNVNNFHIRQKKRMKLESFLTYRGFYHDEIRAAMKEFKL